MTREELVDVLAKDEFEAIVFGGDHEALFYYLTSGFVGFDNQTDEQLIKEYNERELGAYLKTLEDES